MKAVILAGGLGTRISEESALRPKPMIEIGGRPILWHIMKLYSHHNITEFILCLGYKGYIIKEYFANLFMHSCNVTVDGRNGRIQYHHSQAEPWRVTLVDTGEKTLTGGRLKRVKAYLEPGEPFCMTYGDGLSNLDISGLVKFHKRHGKQATLTAVIPPSRFGALDLDGDRVSRFMEKPAGGNGLINGGFFVLNPSVIDRIAGDDTPWEMAPLESLARDSQLMAYRHLGFWQPMDTLRDKIHLDNLWTEGRAPWRIWDSVSSALPRAGASAIESPPLAATASGRGSRP